MDTQSAKAVPYLDGWRGVAILLVLHSHFFLASGGELGVTLFFVLSGLLVSELLFTRDVSLAGFFLRRASRILPTFWLYLLVALVYAAALKPVPYHVRSDELLATLAFLRTYLPPQQSIWSDDWPIGHLWSLNVEEHSYLMLALVAACLRASGARLLLRGFLFFIAAMMFATVVQYARVPPLGASPWMLRSECASLGLTASAALHASRPLCSHRLLRQGHWSIPVLAVSVALLCYAPFAPWLAAPALAPVLLALAINYLDCAPDILLRMLSVRPLRWFGLCSFSLYIWQQPFYRAMKHSVLAQPTALLLALATGTLAFYCFEHPLRCFLNRAWTPALPACRAV